MTPAETHDPLTTPVAFLVFNRPDVTARVFAEIRRARPSRLLVVGDGARENRKAEAELVAETRRVATQVDWPCELQTLFSDTNLGCKRRVASGLRWVFEQSEAAIVLEDDCLPDPSFFPYCQTLLRRYRDDERVGAISGDNFQGGLSRTPHSYYFSKYFHCWGWASWRRVWEKFDVDMQTWPAFRDSGGLQAHSDSACESWYWQRLFDQQHVGPSSSWAFPWLYSCWTQNALTILPDVNLISNIGFSSEGTHCTGEESRFANLPVQALETLSHPELVFRNVEADRYTFERNFYRDTLSRRARRLCRQWLGQQNRAA